MVEEADAHRAQIDAIVAAEAFVMGRNMFTPGRGEWDLDWKGWWGDDPPYHAPVFVLTHHAREPLTMEGGTTFHFVTEGPEAALAAAREAAGDGDVSVAGGAATVRQYLKAGQIDELRLHIAPIVLGQGENLWTGVGDVGLEPVAVSGTSLVTHVTYRRSSHLTLT
jgi:dihydrofolate reductase